MHPPSFHFRSAASAAGVLLTLFLSPARADIAATWDGATANWTDSAHWSTSPIFPNNAPPDLYDVMIGAGAVTLDQAIGINHLSLGGGMLDGAFPLSAAEGLSWTAGTIAGSGTLTLGSGSVSTLATDDTLVLSGRTIEQAGAVTFSSGIVEGGAGAILRNQVGATFSALDQASFFADSINPAWTFENAGSFLARATAGSGFTSMDATFNNTGTVTVDLLGGDSHTLQFGAGGTHSGTFALAADTAVVFGGTTSFQPGAAFTGSGSVLTAGDVTIATDLSLPSLNAVFGEYGIGTHGLSVDSSAEFGAGAVLALEIGGATVGSYGAFTIGDTALLDGELSVRLANAFTPGAGDIFPILVATGGVEGGFANALNDGDRFETADGLGSFAIDYEPDGVFLADFIPAIPEPNGAVQMLAWLPVLLSVRLRHRIIRREE